MMTRPSVHLSGHIISRIRDKGYQFEATEFDKGSLGCIRTKQSIPFNEMPLQVSK